MENKKMLINLARLTGSENFIDFLENNIDNINIDEIEEFNMLLTKALIYEGKVELKCRADKDKLGLFYIEIFERK